LGKKKRPKGKKGEKVSFANRGTRFSSTWEKKGKSHDSAGFFARKKGEGGGGEEESPLGQKKKKKTASLPVGGKGGTVLAKYGKKKRKKSSRVGHSKKRKKRNGEQRVNVSRGKVSDPVGRHFRGGRGGEKKRGRTVTVCQKKNTGTFSGRRRLREERTARSKGRGIVEPRSK